MGPKGGIMEFGGLQISLDAWTKVVWGSGGLRRDREQPARPPGGCFACPVYLYFNPSTPGVACKSQVESKTENGLRT